jgi:hypothetical protein
VQAAVRVHCQVPVASFVGHGHVADDEKRGHKSLVTTPIYGLPGRGHTIQNWFAIFWVSVSRMWGRKRIRGAFR